MKKKYLLLLLICAASVLRAQRLTVQDQTTLRPLASVQVASSSPTFDGVTNSKGVLDIGALKDAAQITLTLPGYKPVTTTYANLATVGFVLVLTEASYNLDEVVVSASRFEEKQKDVAQQIQVIRQADIQFWNQPTTAEMLQSTGQLMVQKSQQGGGSPILRGFEANKVLIVIDGVRLNNAIYRAGHLQNVLRIDQNMLERTEIAFGPGSVMYGSDALGGVMHFYTQRPKLSTTGKAVFSGNAYTRYASAANEITPHLDFNIGLKRFAFLTSITYSQFGDLRTGSVRTGDYPTFGTKPFYVERNGGTDVALANPDPNLQRTTAYWQMDLLQKVLFQQNENLSHLLNLQYSTSGNVPRYDRLTEVGGGGNPNFAQWYYGPERRLLAAYTLAYKSKTLLFDEARVTAAYQDIEESRVSRRFNNVNLRSQIERVWVYSLNADLSKNWGSHELRYGLEATHNQVNSNAFSDNVNSGVRANNNTRYPDGGSQLTTAALYARHSWELNPKWIVSEGLRVSYVRLASKFVDQTFFPFPYSDVNQQNAALNGHLGLVYLPGSDWRLSAALSSAFRAPNVDDVGKVFDSVTGSASTTGTLVVPNPSLRPEYSYNAELSISKVFYQSVRVEATGYYTWLQDLASVQPFALNGNSQVIFNGFTSNVVAQQNAESGRIYGLSLGMQADVSRQLQFLQTLNYTLGRQNTVALGTVPLDHIPPLFGRSAVVLNLKRVKAEAFMLFSAAKPLGEYSPSGEDNLQYATPAGMPSWYTLNLRAGYQFTQNLQLQAGLENLMDVHYRVFASGTSAPGRNLVLTLRGRL